MGRAGPGAPLVLLGARHWLWSRASQIPRADWSQGLLLVHPGPVGPGWDLSICISNKLQVTLPTGLGPHFGLHESGLRCQIWICPLITCVSGK